jgi:hypothetical protein
VIHYVPELRATFEAARRKGLLNIDDVRASRARVEWRASLEMLDEVIAEFDDERVGGLNRA